MTVKNITTADFEQQVKQAAQPVLLDLWAPWCGYCRMLDPVIDEVASDLAAEGSGVAVCRVNIDEEPALADAYAVDTIPTLLLFANGELVDRTVGFKPKDAIMDFIAGAQK